MFVMQIFKQFEHQINFACRLFVIWRLLFGVFHAKEIALLTDFI